MKKLIIHFLLNYHFRMVMKYDRKFKFHCEKYNIIFDETIGKYIAKKHADFHKNY